MTNFLKRTQLDNSRKLLNKVGLGYPFMKSAGGFARKEINLATIKSSVLQILGTERGERVMLPDFGVRLRQFCFDPLDDVTREQISESILFALAKYAPEVEIVNLDITEDERVGYEDLNAFTVSLTIAWSLDPNKTVEIDVRIG